WMRLAGPQVLSDARAVGLAARLCRRLSACSPAVLGKTALICEDGRLAIRSDVPALVGDGAQRDLKELARHLGVTVAGAPDK
ncbi:MAG: hypothetical protein ACOVKV_13720, partial [Novosphingobium sp.]